MFAFELRRQRSSETDADRLGRSLASGLDRVAGNYGRDGAAFAQLLRHGDVRRARGWQPARAENRIILFAGHLDNAADIARDLAVKPPASDDDSALAAFYGRALHEFGAHTDRRLIGEYAAAVIDLETRAVRLVRSPLRAPPLHYCHSDDRVIASNVVRALFAAGVTRKLDHAKLADMALFNASNEARGWYEGIDRVALGTMVTLADGRKTVERYYDLGDLRPLARMDRTEMIETARDLFYQGTRAALAGSARPAVMLSGGLDSTLVAASAAAVMPGQAPIDTYTFCAASDWSGHSRPGTYGDERPRVEAFCRRNPRLRPHFHGDTKRHFDDDLTAMFHAIGAAPQGLVNLGAYHGMWRDARADGCDRVLLGEFGNMTVSDDGSWAYADLLTRLRWRELLDALRQAPPDGRSLPRRFAALALMPFLPDRLWHWQRKVRGVGNLYIDASPLKASYAAKSGALARSAAAGLPNPRFPLRDRLAMIREVHDNAWGEFSDVYHGFEQIYGLEQRDPTAYRPLFEFCAGLPAEMVLHGGQNRYLARELLKGHMDEGDRLSPLKGSHNADWHERMAPRRADIRRELDQLSADPAMAAMFDFDRLIGALDDWKDLPDMTPAQAFTCSAAVPRALLFARFIRHVDGRNAF